MSTDDVMAAARAVVKGGAHACPGCMVSWSRVREVRNIESMRKLPSQSGLLTCDACGLIYCIIAGRVRHLTARERAEVRHRPDAKVIRAFQERIVSKLIG